MQESILTECDMSHSKYHNFLTTAPISVKKIAKCSPGCRLQFALIFIIKLSQTRVLWPFQWRTLVQKIAIFESTMKRTSAVHILELCIFPWRVQTVALDCAWRFKTCVSRLAEAWRHSCRNNPPCEFQTSEQIHAQQCPTQSSQIYRCDMPVLYMFQPEVFLLSVLPETLNYL